MLSAVALVVAILALGVALYVLFGAKNRSIIHLAEFNGLHPDLKELWRVNVTEGLMPIVIDAVNEEYEKLSDVQKRGVQLQMEAELLRARGMVTEARAQLLRAATRAPVKIVRTVAPKKTRSPSSAATNA